MTTETIITLGFTIALASVAVVPYYRKFKRKESDARKKLAALELTGMSAAAAMHPHFDALACIGCGTCVSACPEGEVIAVINGKATLVHGSKCVGHGLCAEACPVGAITMVMAPPGRSANIPVLGADLETSVPGIFIAGELGGMGLIKNAVTQGKLAVESISRRPQSTNGILDVVVVGAGPAGLAAGLMALERGLRFAVLEQEDAGGTILQYPRRKIVMTSPVELPIWGPLKLRETSKEALLDVWQKILEETKLQVRVREKVVDIQKLESGFRVVSSKGNYEARHVVLALGRRGTPRKLGVPGEQLSKVMYRLIDAGTYKESDLLVVGGGDSAIEASAALALQGSNRVTLSYRQNEFSRIKDRNREHLEGLRKRGKIRVLLGSNVRIIREQEVLIEKADGPEVLRNDYVFVCAGGEMPFEFLRRSGIRFHQHLLDVPTTQSPAAGPADLKKELIRPDSR